MRLKVKLTVQKEVMGGAVLQQSFVVEFAIRNKQCEDCAKQYTDGTWSAVVQVGISFGKSTARAGGDHFQRHASGRRR